MKTKKIDIRLLLCIASLLTVSFAFAQQETPAGLPYSPYPDNVYVTKVMHFDISCWKIAAAGGTWYFEDGTTKGSSGFSSAFDMVGNDWIGNDADKGYNTSPKGTGKHEYRGFPNFGGDNFGHPQRSSSAKSKWIDENGNDITFNNALEGDHLILLNYNSTYEVEYHFYTSHIAIKVIKASDKFAFLYEGPIGGEQESNTVDYWMTNTGVKNAKQCGTTACSSPFIYFVDSDPNDTDVLYLGAKDLTSGVGGESWVAASNMVIVSYGRTGSYPNDTRKFSGTAPLCVFGFHPKAAGHNGIATFIEDRLAAPYTGPVSVGAPNVSFTSPSGNEDLTAPASITLSATASDEEGSVAKVEFFNGDQLLFSDTQVPYTYEWTNISAGSYSIKVVATDDEGNTSQDVVSVTVNVPQTPYGGTAWPVPGKIELEDFDEGGNGNAYYDDSPGTSVPTPPNYRSTEDVDIENCSDTDGGFNIGYGIAGEWLEYTVDVAASGTYDIEFRVACNGDGRTISLETDGVALATDVAIPNTGGWQTWQTLTMKDVELTAGEQVIRVTIGAANYVNLNNMTFVSKAVETPPTIEITSPADKSEFTTNETIAINATALATDATIVDVKFYANNELLYTDNTAPYSYDWSGMAIGNHVIKVVATDSKDSQSSDEITVSVIKASLNLQLKAGWNMVGCPLSGSTDIETALSSIWNQVETVKDFDGFWNVASDPVLNSLNSLKWGKGYYIKVKSPCTLTW